MKYLKIEVKPEDVMPGDIFRVDSGSSSMIGLKSSFYEVIENLGDKKTARKLKIVNGQPVKTRSKITEWGNHKNPKNGLALVWRAQSNTGE